MIYVQGSGPANAKLMIVTDAPSEQEVMAQSYFVGPVGSIFENILRQAGLSRDEFFITGVCGYRPPMGKFEKFSDIGINVEEEVKKLFNTIIFNDWYVIPKIN